MKLENQYNTPEQGKRLVELGVDPKMAHFLWHGLLDGSMKLLPWTPMVGIPAFSVAELGVMIGLKNKVIPIYDQAYFDCAGFCSSIFFRQKRVPIKDFRTEAIELCDWLISDISTGAIAPAECNERLKNA